MYRFETPLSTFSAQSEEDLGTVRVRGSWGVSPARSPVFSTDSPTPSKSINPGEFFGNEEARASVHLSFYFWAGVHLGVRRGYGEQSGERQHGGIVGEHRSFCKHCVFEGGRVDGDLPRTVLAGLHRGRSEAEYKCLAQSWHLQRGRRGVGLLRRGEHGDCNGQCEQWSEC